MGKVKKIGIVFILVGLCLPTVLLPFISEFHPLPNVCLTSNFFNNLGNMELVLWEKQTTLHDKIATTNYRSKMTIPYRYIFILGVVLVCTGIGMITLSGSNKGKLKY